MFAFDKESYEKHFQLNCNFVFCIEYSLASEIVNTDHFQTRNGLIYEVNSEKPFSGNIIKRYKNGKKQADYSYKDGKKYGLATVWYENGQKKAEAHYKDGKRDGLDTNWYENGQRRQRYSIDRA